MDASSSPRPPARPELLAPAGEPRALRAALAAGADAVYFGLERWSARAFAGNFAGERVVEAVETAHLYDARAYLALNTQLKDAEVEPALEALEAPYLAGLDALIVTDLGFAARVRETYPGLDLHASTQLNTHDSAQLAALARLGFRRAVLARELSLAEIAALDPAGLELEVFVHGALCYGYSGDCLLSSMVGGRSGNRGRCSQSCRLRYALRRDSSPPEPAGAEASRVMSTSDLAAAGVLPQLLAAGATSFKIEGRMKDAGYVGVTTAVYRDALDAALADPEGYAVLPEWSARLEQSFSRSFTTAHLEGRHAEVRSGGRGGHRGVLVGRVARVDDSTGEAEIRLSRPVAAGDLVYLYTSSGQTEPQRLEESGDDHVTLRLRERVGPKDRLFRLAAAETDELARDLETARVVRRPVVLDMSLDGEEGRPATLAVAVAGGEEPVTVASTVLLAGARTAALTADKAREALGALGGTPYRLGELRFSVDPGLFLGIGDLKDVRRRAVAALGERRVASRRRQPPRVAPSPGAPPFSPGPSTPALPPGTPDVILALRPGERPLDAPGIGRLCLDVQTTDDVAAVAASAVALRSVGLPIRLRLPEVVFDADGGWLRDVLAVGWDAVSVRQLGVVAPAATASSPGGRPADLVLESPLQGLNGLTAAVVAGLAGRPAAAVMVSPEASLEEIAGLRAAMAAGPPPLEPVPALEALAFGRQQVLRARDRLGAAEELYAAPGRGEHVGLVLEDAKGYAFPADVDAAGTRVFNARVTNLAPNLDELRDAGVEALLVVQSDLDTDERRAFASGGLPALAAFASRDRSTTGHLFRGVA